MQGFIKRRRYVEKLVISVGNLWLGGKRVDGGQLLSFLNIGANQNLVGLSQYRPVDKN